MSPAPLLDTTDLAVSFGGVNALDGVDLSVTSGHLVGLIGPNGAGKTTTIDALCGFVPARGAVRFAGDDVTGWTPDQRARAGLVRTWQSLELFDDLTVAENCRVAAEPPSLRRALRDLVAPGRATEPESVRHALALVGLQAVADRHPDELSLGQRKLVGVARALAARPQLLLLDEPAAGLDTEESLALGRVLRTLIDEGLTVLLVDHDMGLVLSVCDTIYVLDFGHVIAEGPPAKVRADPQVIAAYLGRSADSPAPEAAS